jgi:hypothetical protein
VLFICLRFLLPYLNNSLIEDEAVEISSTMFEETSEKDFNWFSFCCLLLTSLAEYPALPGEKRNRTSSS